MFLYFTGVQDIHYNEYLLLEQLESCTEMLEKAERFELLGHLYRLIIPIYESKRNYEALSNCYTHLAQACNKVVEVTKSGKRLLGRFYRVAFFGSVSINGDNLERKQIEDDCSLNLYIQGILRGGKRPGIYLQRAEGDVVVGDIGAA